MRIIKPTQIDQLPLTPQPNRHMSVLMATTGDKKSLAKLFGNSQGRRTSHFHTSDETRNRLEKDLQ